MIRLLKKILRIEDRTNKNNSFAGNSKLTKPRETVAEKKESITIKCASCDAVIEASGFDAHIVCPYCSTQYSFYNDLLDLDTDPVFNRALNGLHSVVRPSDDCYFYAEMVCLAGSLINDRQLVHLTKLDKLKRLNLDDTKISDAGIQYITKLHSIETLLLNNTRITDKTLSVIQNHLNITCLELDGTAVTDSGLKYIAKLQNLEELSLRDTDIGDEGVSYLTEIPVLKKVQLDGTLITENALYELAACPNVEDVTIEFLDFNMAEVLRNGGARLFFKQYTVDFSRQSLTDEDLALLKDYNTVRSLNLRYNKISGNGLVHIQKLGNLERLYLSSNPLNDSAVSILKQMKNLKEISINRTSVSEKSAEKLKTALPACRVWY